MQYSFQFDEDLQQEWRWTERYASQPEILAYMGHVADRYNLRRDFTFDTRIEAATFDEASHTWMVETDGGEKIRTRYFIMGVGCLSAPIRPTFEGEVNYKGEVYQTSLWPKDPVDFTGKRVGIIGTGSSAIQSLPLIAKEAEHVYLYQRTPNFVVPAQNRSLSDEEVALIKSDYKGFRAKAYAGLTAFLFPRHDQSYFDLSPEERRIRLDEQWEIGGLPFLGAFNDILFDGGQRRGREILAQPDRRDCRRSENCRLADTGRIFRLQAPMRGTGYYETFNRDNVSLIDVSNLGIERLTETGLRAEGVDYDLDAIVYATGFDAMTGSVTRIKITGTNGQTIQEKWADGPATYIGLTISGFPTCSTWSAPAAHRSSQPW